MMIDGRGLESKAIVYIEHCRYSCCLKIQKRPTIFGSYPLLLSTTKIQALCWAQCFPNYAQPWRSQPDIGDPYMPEKRKRSHRCPLRNNDEDLCLSNSI